MNAKMGLDSRFTTTLLILKLINIDKFRDMEKSMEKKRLSYHVRPQNNLSRCAKTTTVSDLTMTF